MPRILVLSTNNISDPGIDLAGSSHMHYSPEVIVISVPCTSGIKPSWVLYALQQGFDGVFIAADGDECGYLSDCSERTLADRGQRPRRCSPRTRSTAAAAAMSAICSVCAEPFTSQVRDFTEALWPEA